MIYAILDSNGRCINRVLWDSTTEWEPPVGCTAVPDPDNNYPIWSEPQRARDELGLYVGDDPTTPNVNEAWVQP
jgi:hypothetical protein